MVGLTNAERCLIQCNGETLRGVRKEFRENVFKQISTFITANNY